MSKISYANMKLKTKADTVIVKYEDNDIEVLQYLPFEDKYDLIMVALQKANEEDIYNPLKLDMYFHLYLVYMYTNINFTDKQREDESKLFDTLESNGIIDIVVEAIPEEEYNNLLSLMNETMERKTTYKLSVSGLIQKVIADLPTQAKAMQDILDNFDPEQYQNVINFAKAANGGRDIKVSKVKSN